jgi:hypothetical protein
VCDSPLLYFRSRHRLAAVQFQHFGDALTLQNSENYVQSVKNINSGVGWGGGGGCGLHILVSVGSEGSVCTG